jgi:hypothetical protein
MCAWQSADACVRVKCQNYHAAKGRIVVEGHDARWLCTSTALRMSTRSRSLRSIRPAAGCCPSPCPLKRTADSRSRNDTHPSIPCLFFLEAKRNRQYIATPDRKRGNAHSLYVLLSPWIYFGRPGHPPQGSDRLNATCRPYDRARRLPPPPQPPPSHLLAATYTHGSVVRRLRVRAFAPAFAPVHLPLPPRISLGRAAIPTNGADRQDSAEQLSDRDKRGGLT